MSFKAFVHTIAIAGSSDVEEERRRARYVIERWNAAHSSASGRMLLPVDSKNNVASLLGSRTQEVVNSQIIEPADLLVAMFWERIGNPTGLAPGGTVEEIESFLKAGKPVMVYFRESSPEDLKRPAAFRAAREQLNAVARFRERCQSIGLIGTYVSVQEFQEQFTHELAVLANKLPSLERGRRRRG